MTKFKVTHFASWTMTKNGVVKEYDSFKTFASALEKSHRQVGKKKNLPVFIMGEVDPPHRKNANVQNIYGFWGDIDNEYATSVDGREKYLSAKHPITKSEIVAALKREGLSFAVYTTFNHMTGRTSCGKKIPRLRVLIPFNMKCESSILKPTHQWFVELVSGLRPGVPIEELGIDASPEKPAQASVIYASPSYCTVEGLFHFENGEPLDASYLFENYLAEPGITPKEIFTTSDRREESKYSSSRVDIVEFAKLINVDITSISEDENPEGGKVQIFKLRRCPLMHHEKNQTGAYFFSRIDDGKPSFYCHHNSCRGKNWGDIQNRFSMELKESSKGLEAKQENKIKNSIAQLSSVSETSDIIAAIDLMAASSLSPIHEEKLLSSLRYKTKLSIKSLRDYFRERKKEFLKEQKGGEVLVRKNLVNEVKNHFGEGNIIFKDGVFWTWLNKGVWEPVSKLEVEQLVISKMPSDKDFQGSYIKDALNALKATLYVKEELNLVEGSLVVNVKNGELWLNEKSWVWELRPHNKNNYLTSQLPIEYDSEALAPNWHKFKLDLFSDYREILLEEAAVLNSKGVPLFELQSNIRIILSSKGCEFSGNIQKKVGKSFLDSIRRYKLLDEIIGYTIIPTATLEKIFFLQGAPGTGKSRVLKVVESMLGKENYSSVNPLSADDRFNRGRYLGKLANITSELEESKLLPVGFLRSVASGDSVDGEAKYGDPYSYKPYSTFLIGCNDFPKMKDSQGAFLDRVVVLEFN